jgi:hypothetical protein
MKIEMGESLFYSWIRHVKECQVVQTNWKPSPSWTLYNEAALIDFMSAAKERFSKKYGYDVFKNNSLQQLLRQAEVDAIGIDMSKARTGVYAVDVAYHEEGLAYGDRKKTVEKVLQKFLRTAMCINGYFNIAKGEIIFASPKIHNAVIADLESCIAEINALFCENGFDFSARVIANHDFNELVLKPILVASDGVSDTSELFLRAYGLVKMFADKSVTKKPSVKEGSCSETISGKTMSELKIGRIVQTVLREVLESEIVSIEEIMLMRGKEYSKQVFGIDFPLLVLADAEPRAVRYYVKALEVYGNRYYLCSQWFEGNRALLMAWLQNHAAKL